MQTPKSRCICESRNIRLLGTARSESESHNEDCIVSLPCPKWLLANDMEANTGIEGYCVLIRLLHFAK